MRPCYTARWRGSFRAARAWRPAVTNESENQSTARLKSLSMNRAVVGQASRLPPGRPAPGFVAGETPAKTAGTAAPRLPRLCSWSQCAQSMAWGLSMNRSAELRPRQDHRAGKSAHAPRWSSALRSRGSWPNVKKWRGAGCLAYLSASGKLMESRYRLLSARMRATSVRPIAYRTGAARSGDSEMSL